ncbi:MAG: hypothetical protein HUU34_05965 [Saprospiraceae bacterium]|nr:hypothetical protein [Saprospiraceae bacterium]
MATQTNSQSPNLISGKLTDKFNRVLGNLLVQVYDRDMRSEELLGETTTDQAGKYKITWLQSQLSGRGKETADIVIKVFTREKKTLLFATDIDSVRFNASEKEEINIIIEQPIQPETVEYDTILKQVRFLAGSVAITDLQENEQHRDIAFLSKEARIASEKIEHLVVAHRLEAASQIEAPFFYALLRKNTLLRKNFSNSFQVRLMIDINTEILPVLYDAAMTEPKSMQRDVAAAVKEMIVSNKVAKETKKHIEGLQQYKQKAENYYQNEHPRKALNIISRFVSEDKIGEIGKLFEENKNDLNGFLKKITDNSFFKTDEEAKDAKTIVALVELLGFDETIVAQVKESKNIKNPEDVRRLAALNKAEWKEVLTKSADNINLFGEKIDKKRIDLHASSLARKLEKEFPTVAFAAQLGREKKAVLKNQKAIKAFFAKYEDFDLQHTNIDLFLKEQEMDTEQSHAMREELKLVQRVFKLAPHYGKTNALLEQKIHSSQSITAVGETRFINEIASKAGINRKEAKLIYKKAERKSLAATILLGELQEYQRARDIHAIENAGMARDLEAVNKKFPNLQSLFQLTDVCACDHCRSVYGPAAYLVEILQFLENRSVINTITGSTGQLAKNVLFERRPDLGEIDLGCENANTPVPYIDLVCELLEEAVAPDPGIAYTGALSIGPDPLTGKISNDLLTELQRPSASIPVSDQAQIYRTEDETTINGPEVAPYKPHYLRDKKAVCKIIHNGGSDYSIFRLRQTLSSAEELAAAPEYVNTYAYNELRSQSYAFQLPFDLNHVEAKAYFNRFGISRTSLMKTFQTPALSDESIAAERLGLTDAERILIVTPDAPNQQYYWNTLSATASDEMRVVDTFLTKTGLTYKELEILLSLKFITNDDNLFIAHHYDEPLVENPTISCDAANKEIANLNEDALDRIHRFLRLQKKTGWKFETINEIISQSGLGNGQLDNNCLVLAADLLTLSEETGLSLDELLGFYGEIPYKSIQSDVQKPLYHRVFLNKARNGFIDEDLLPEKIDETHGTQLLATNKTSLAVCLQVSEQDFDNINEKIGLTTFGKLLPEVATPIPFYNLSFLYAASKLMRKLKLKADDFIILTKLTGINIQGSPSATLAFVQAARALQKLSLKFADVQFMLHHEATNLTDLEIKDDKIKQILEKLQVDYQKVYTATKSPFDSNLTADEQKETLQAMLSKLIAVGETEVKKIIDFVDRNWRTSVNDAKIFVDEIFSNLFDTSDIKSSLDALDIVPPENDFSNESKNVIAAWMTAISSYNFANEKKDLLVQNLLTTFKTNADVANLVLKYARLKQPAPGTVFINDILLADALIDTVNPAINLPEISEINFPDQYNALRLLHKLFPLIHSFELGNPELEWYFQHNSDLDWFLWDEIPYEPGQNPVDYHRFVAFMEILSLARQLTPISDPTDVENPVDFFSVAEMLLPGSTTTRSEFIEKLALLIGYFKDHVDAMEAFLFPVWSLDNFRNPGKWRALENGLDYLRKLGCTIDQIQEFIKPVLTDMDTKTLRIALKARYDEDTWLGTLKEIMDAIRPQKRDALVAYLLAANPEMKDENDLFDYFLVDVEMEACMPSSRIVQAHGTVQLFVQRCLMGLEPTAAADLNNDKSWEQWKWMKNYRVWEANRKVFLYPENWIEAELRDDKSFLFTELENELSQNELTDFTAEEAFIKYLEKLDNIAFLEVVATWYQSDIKTMHVFARTKGGDPAIYYYRRFEQESYWTPWEKVELDITGDHLLAFVRNNRLHLAWPVFSEEADPEQKSKVPSDSDQENPEGVDIAKPKRKLKIQLAISEMANKKWQPKKISIEAIRTPKDFTDTHISRKGINMVYNEFGQQVLFLRQISKKVDVYDSEEFIQRIIGAFNISGCKGYPEGARFLAMYHLNFIPKFDYTKMVTQRYKENDKELNILSVLNVHSILTSNHSDQILGSSPDTFRITYPHQFTKIDFVAFILELLHLFNSGNARNPESLKWPMGTLLPYFMEDSKHAYVIIPGFYKKPAGPPTPEMRTGSNVLQLIEDAEALLKALVDYQANPSDDKQMQLLEDFQEVIKELITYTSLGYGEQFRNMYHPLVCALKKILYKEGIPALMKRETQFPSTTFSFESHYGPNPNIVPKTYLLREGAAVGRWPEEDLDFTIDGSYSGYNWELFFHIPFLLASRLTKNHRFKEAMTWFHYMFNPTGALEGTSPQKYWVTKPFYIRQEYLSQRIDTLLFRIADPDTPERKELEDAIKQWRNKPFKPHVIARSRPVAYQKAILMRYIDNLTEWGDHLFRQDTQESIVQATQLYILADKLLGPKPRIIPPAIKPPYETYNQISAKLDAFGNALIDLENILPDLSDLPEGGAELPPAPITLSMLYFCIPPNDKMLEYWDRIADRLFKIRHCQNIDGVERSLALFAPPIDPGMLVRATAAGLDISSVLAGVNAPTPYYRFNVLSQKATELANEVRGLGSSLLQALEKKDAEAMALLRSELEIKILNAVSDMKKLQTAEASEQINILNQTKKVTEERQLYYANIEKITSKEQLNLDKLQESHEWQLAAQISYTLGGVFSLIPESIIGAAGFGGTPTVKVKWGGVNLANATKAAGDVLNILSSVASYAASQASILGGYQRRFDDWKLQERLATLEIKSIDKQITAAEIRKKIAETDLKNHILQIENARKTDEFMRSKYTSQELYDWMIGQVSSVYFSAYKLAHDFAKKAERCYQFELGNDDTFISYGYWDSRKKGLQSADLLLHDIKRMEASYMEKNRREYEITKHISLAQLDPLALVSLRATGACYFEVPEVLFDLDHAGHYFRRVKSVSISLPCVVGPYTSVSAKLSLVTNKYRKNANLLPNEPEYAEITQNDERFVYNIGAIQSIATSQSQNDSGVFELNFRDERYLPFEGTGAIGSWRLELPPKDLSQFNYETISDVILHFKYTAREGGSSLRRSCREALKAQLANIRQELDQTGLHVAINLRHDMPNEWYQLKQNAFVDLIIDKSRLPYLAQMSNATIDSVMFVSKSQSNPDSITLKIGEGEDSITLGQITDWQLCSGQTHAIALDTLFRLSITSAPQLADLEQLMMVVKFSF